MKALRPAVSRLPIVDHRRISVQSGICATREPLDRELPITPVGTFSNSAFCVGCAERWSAVLPSPNRKRESTEVFDAASLDRQCG